MLRLRWDLISLGMMLSIIILEIAKPILKTWNAIGIVIHTELYDTYTLNNIYVILEDALKKIKLAHT